ncbi:MAG: hypothetical protein PHQ42_04190 [Patescibacteria group bacterium]|nr:hypothetical protein [Patescibacteria group bacterium]
MVFQRSDESFALVKPKARIKFADMRHLISSQILRCFRADLFQKPGTPISQQKYIDLLWSSINKGSYPEFIPKIPEGCLSPFLVLPRTFADCKDQAEKIEKAMNGRVEFNEFSRTITVKTRERTIIFSEIDFSSWYTMLSINQPRWPYLLLRPMNLERLEKKLDEFSPEEILAIIFQCTA